MARPQLAVGLAALAACTYQQRTLECPPSCPRGGDTRSSGPGDFVGGDLTGGDLARGDVAYSDPFIPPADALLDGGLGPLDGGGPTDIGPSDGSGDSGFTPPGDLMGLSSVVLSAGMGTINSPITIGGFDQVVLHFLLTGDPLADTFLTDVVVDASGTAEDDLDFTTVSLYRDDNADGVLQTMLDTYVNGDIFGTDNGVAFLSGLFETLTAGADTGFFITVDVDDYARIGGSLTVSLSRMGVIAEDAGSGAVVVTGSSVTGAPVVIGGGPFAFSQFPIPNETLSAVSIASGDFDLDGVEDYAVMLSDTNIKVVRTSSVGGMFTGFTELYASADVGGGPHRLNVADVDRDGDLDFIRTQADGLIISTNDRGSLGAPMVETSFGQVRDSVVVDFDRNSFPDIVSVDYVDGTLHLDQNQRDGTFSTSNGPSLPSGCGEIAAADFNGDGWDDLAVRCFDELYTLQGGAGTFGMPALHFASGAGGILVGDFSQDSYPDLIAMDDGNIELTLFHSAGPGAVNLQVNLTSPHSSTLGYEDAPRSGTSGDWDGDGILDIAVAHRGSVGMDSFESIVALIGENSGPPDYSFPASFSYRASPDPGEMVVADVNRDGAPDILGVRGAGTSISVLFGAGPTGGRSPTFSTAQAHGMLDGPLHTAVGDFNRDGRPDFAVAESDSIAVFINDGDGSSFTRGTPDLTLLVTLTIRDLEAADIDRDGVDDLVFVVTGGAQDVVRWVMMNRNGTLGTNGTALGLGARGSLGMDLGDVDRDGTLDAVVAEATADKLQIYLGNGNGFDNANMNDSIDPIANQPVAVTLVEFSPTGRLDFVVLDAANNIEVDSGYGAPPWLGPGNRIPLNAAVGSASAMAVADYTGDGTPDILVGGTGGTDLQLFTGNPVQPFITVAASTLMAVGGSVLDVALIDTDRDGDLDVVAPRAVGMMILSYDLVVIQTIDRAAVTFGPPLPVTGGVGGRMSVGDFNLDGDLDVLTATSPTIVPGAALVFMGQ